MVQLAKKSQTQGRITISTIANAIFHDIGMSSDEWSFCDILFIRLFERVNKKYLVGSAFVLHVSCFLALFSLSSAEDLMRTIVDIYLDSESMKDNLDGVGKTKKNGNEEEQCDDEKKSKTPKPRNNSSRNGEDMIAVKTCETIFRDVIMNTTRATDRQVAEKVELFQEYCAATAIVVSVPDEMSKVRVKSFVHFCSKLHPTVMWPVLMIRKQIRVKFLGDSFWEYLYSSDFSKFLQRSKTSRSVFWSLEVMSKVYPISNKKIVDYKNGTADILRSIIERKKTQKLFPNSLYSVSTATRSVQAGNGVWKECREPSFRWSRRPSIAHDLFSYSHQGTGQSRERITKHFAKCMKKTKHKDKSKGISIMMSHKNKGTEIIPEVSDDDIQRSKESDVESDDDYGSSDDAFHDSKILLCQQHDTNSLDCSFNSGDFTESSDKQPVPPLSPARSNTSRPSLSRKLSGQHDDWDSTSSQDRTMSTSPPQCTSASKPKLLSSPPTSPKARPPFVRKHSGRILNDDISPDENDPFNMKDYFHQEISPSTSPPSDDKQNSQIESQPSPPPNIMSRPSFVRKPSGEHESNAPSPSSVANLDYGLSDICCTKSDLFTSPTRPPSTSSVSTSNDSGNECVDFPRESKRMFSLSCEVEWRVENAMKNLNVLIVEDSDIQRKFMTRRLLAMMRVDMVDYDSAMPPVVSAANGEIALEMVDSVYERTGRCYDILLVDEVLDGAGGILKGHEVIHKLRQREDLARTLMIGCSSNIEEYGKSFLDAGANAVWAKPIKDVEQVRDCIKKLIAEIFEEDYMEKCCSLSPKKGGTI